MSERSIKVVEIHFALCLKLVKEVEEVEGKDSARTGPSCWEPAGAKELAMAGGHICLGLITIAVHDSCAVDAREVKECNRCGLRWTKAGITDDVTELVRHP